MQCLQFVKYEACKANRAATLDALTNRVNIEARTTTLLTTNRKISFKATYEASRCRRRRDRQTISPSAITCWSEYDAPTRVTSIEIDSRGARLLLPWESAPGENIKVSLANEMGEYRTTTARVVWTQPLQNSTRVIAGLCFEEEVRLHESKLAA